MIKKISDFIIKSRQKTKKELIKAMNTYKFLSFLYFGIATFCLIYGTLKLTHLPVMAILFGLPMIFLFYMFFTLISLSFADSKERCNILIELKEIKDKLDKKENEDYVKKIK